MRLLIGFWLVGWFKVDPIWLGWVSVTIEGLITGRLLISDGYHHIGYGGQWVPVILDARQY